MPQPLNIDVVMPFCARHCAHCTNPVVIGADASRRAAYLDALLAEVDATAGDLKGLEATSLHVCGGTPQIFSPQELTRAVGTIRERIAFAQDPQILVDAMPGKLSRDALHAYRDAGVTSLLVNLVTTQGAEHLALGRPCDPGDARPLFQMFEQEGFLEYGISIAIGLPHQTPDSFGRTLRDTFFYAPKFVVIEDASHVMAGTDPSARQHQTMREQARKLLGPNAFTEVVPGLWALPGHEPTGLVVRHAACPGDAAIASVGFGLGAHSRYNGIWYDNIRDLDAYIDAHGDPKRTMLKAGECQ